MILSNDSRHKVDNGWYMDMVVDSKWYDSIFYVRFRQTNSGGKVTVTKLILRGFCSNKNAHAALRKSENNFNATAQVTIDIDAIRMPLNELNRLSTPR